MITKHPTLPLENKTVIVLERGSKMSICGWTHLVTLERRQASWSLPLPVIRRMCF